MGISDAQFKAFLRVALRDLTDALEVATPEEKDRIIKSLAEDFQKSLEDQRQKEHQETFRCSFLCLTYLSEAWWRLRFRSQGLRWYSAGLEN